MARPARFAIEDIRAKALEIVDQGGLGALTMRRLAADLGTGPMTIYNYVDDRLGLEELVVDAVADGLVLPEPGEDWLDDVNAIATALWTAVRRHPAAIPLILTRRTSTPSSFRAADALVGALRRGGFEGAQLLAAFRAVTGFVMGIAQAELAGPLTSGTGVLAAAGRIETLAGEDYPNLAALAGIGSASKPGEDFAGGLALVLAGLEAAAQGSGSRP